MVSVSEFLGAYGAVLATALAAREVWLYRQRRIPKLDVSASMLLVLEQMTQISKEALLGKEDLDIPWIITVEAINRGGAKQYITGIDLLQDFGRDGSRRDRAPLDYPVALEPGEPVTVEFRSNTSKIDFTFPIVADVTVSAGEKFESDPFGPTEGHGLSVTFPRSDLGDLEELVESLGLEFPHVPIHEVRPPRPLPRDKTE